MAKKPAAPAAPKAPASKPADQGSVQLNRLRVPADLSKIARQPDPMCPCGSNKVTVTRAIERYWIEMIELHRATRSVLSAEAWQTLIALFDRKIIVAKKLSRPGLIDTEGVEPDEDDIDDGVTLPDSPFKMPVSVPMRPVKKGAIPDAAKTNGHVANGKPAKDATG